MTSRGARTATPRADEHVARGLEDAPAGNTVEDHAFAIVITGAGMGDEEPAHVEPAPSPHGESVGLPMRIVVSPAPGRLRLLPAVQFHDGHEWVSAGQGVAEVANGPNIHLVVAPHDARVAGVMVRDGEPVAQGQPLLWLDETARRPPAPQAGGEPT